MAIVFSEYIYVTWNDAGVHVIFTSEEALREENEDKLCYMVKNRDTKAICDFIRTIPDDYFFFVKMKWNNVVAWEDKCETEIKFLSMTEEEIEKLIISRNWTIDEFGLYNFT